MLEALPVLFRSPLLGNQFLAKHLGLKNNLVLKNSLCPSLVTATRTTIIVKRKFPVQLYKEGNAPSIKEKNHFFDFVENTDVKPDPLVSVVLTTYVKGIGNDGDIVSMKRTAAYRNLLLPGFATYVTPESLEYSQNLKKDEVAQEKTVSPVVEMTIGYLENRCIRIDMNKETEWTIEPWHVRVSLRKSGVHVLSEQSIELPAEPIKGPDMNLEGKDFFITLTINKKEKVKVRCRIHHWSTSLVDRPPYVVDHWLVPGELIFPENENNNTNNTSHSSSL